MSRPARLQRLRHRLALDVADHTLDALGGRLVRWREVAILWGEVQAPLVRGITPDDTGQPQPIAEVRIRVRRRSMLAGGQRLRWGTRTFLLRAIRDDGVSPFVELLTEELSHDDSQ